MSVYLELQEDLFDLMGADSADAQDMVKRSINRYYSHIRSVTDNDEEVRDFSITTGTTERMGLPLEVKEVLDIEDAVNRRSLREISRVEINRRYPGSTTSGTPRRYYHYGRYGVQVQPATAEAIRFVSSSSADATNYFARIRGRATAGGPLLNEQITLNGTSTVDTSNTYLEVEEIVFSKASGVAVRAGTMTVTGATSGTTFATVPSGIDIPRHIWIGFYPIPGAATTLTVQAAARKPPLINNDDIPAFDEDYHYLLVSGPASELLPLVGKGELAAQKLIEFRDGLDALQSANNTTPNIINDFANVTTNPELNDRPLIAGVDF
jgi:hypothetical protein